MAERHIYTVNLRKARAVSRRNRAGRAMNILREFVQQHSKVDNLHISSAVNEEVWERGATRPPHSISIQVVEQDGVAHVELADHELELEPVDEEPEKTAEELRDEEIAELNVDEVKELVDGNAVSAERALDIEYAGKNRKTLIEWLQRRVGEPETEEDAAAEIAAEELEAEEAAEREAEATAEEAEETYDLPDDIVTVFREGTIPDGKDAAKELGKQEFEKLLNFEEAHQNRKGMKKFLRSNMN